MLLDTTEGENSIPNEQSELMHAVGLRMHHQKATRVLRSVTRYRLSGTESVMGKDTVQRDVQGVTAMLTRTSS